MDKEIAIIALQKAVEKRKRRNELLKATDYFLLPDCNR